MTSLVSWIAVDSRAQTAIYIAADSRISWPDGRHWDSGRKLFAATRYPEILGYVGDVQFPSLILGQIIDMIDAGLLFTSADSPASKQSKVSSIIRRAFKTHPTEKSLPFTILYCTRENQGMESVFHMSKLRRDSDDRWNQTWARIPTTSGTIDVLGSGKQFVDEWLSKWAESTEGGTSRSIFGAFCDSLRAGADTKSGGPPQLVGLHKKGFGKSFGVIHQRKRFLFGVQVDKSEQLAALEWHNDLFERCDWQTKRRLPEAQQHERPIFA